MDCSHYNPHRNGQEKVTLPLLIPALGILVCAFIWLHLSGYAQILGVIWIGVGLLVAWFMQGSQKPIAQPQ
jgi:putrescine importer